MTLVMIFPHLVFSASTEIITLPEEQILLPTTNFYQDKQDILSGCKNFSLLHWWIHYWLFGSPTTLSGLERAWNGQQTCRHPITTLNAIRLLSFLHQGALDPGKAQHYLSRQNPELFHELYKNLRSKQDDLLRTNPTQCVPKNPSRVPEPYLV